MDKQFETIYRLRYLAYERGKQVKSHRFDSPLIPVALQLLTAWKRKKAVPAGMIVAPKFYGGRPKVKRVKQMPKTEDRQCIWAEACVSFSNIGQK